MNKEDFYKLTDDQWGKIIPVLEDFVQEYPEMGFCHPEYIIDTLVKFDSERLNRIKEILNEE